MVWQHLRRLVVSQCRLLARNSLKEFSLRKLLWLFVLANLIGSFPGSTVCKIAECLPKCEVVGAQDVSPLIVSSGVAGDGESGNLYVRRSTRRPSSYSEC